MPHSLILFDVDGTLVDSQNDIVAAMTHAFESNRLTAPSRAETLSIVGLSVPEAIRMLAPTQDLAVQTALAAAFRTGPAHAGARSDPLYPGAADLIAELARHDDLVLGVATGKSRRGVTRLFDRYKWHDHFGTIQTADTNTSKPHPDMILSALAETGVDAAQCLMIGDTRYDIAMGRAAEVHTIGVAWGYHPITELEAAGAHMIVHDFAALAREIEMWRNR